MKTTYEISGITKLSELDSYENGCYAPGGDDYIDVNLSAKTTTELAQKFADFVGVSIDDLETNACEAGRIDASRTERADGEEPTETELEAWRKGECDLYYVTYIAYVECVTRTRAGSKEPQA